MPVKIIHKRYLVFKISECTGLKKEILDIYIKLFGIVHLSLSNFSYVVLHRDILIISVGSQYISSAITAVTYYSLTTKCIVTLLDICNTLKECKTKYLK